MLVLICDLKRENFSRKLEFSTMQIPELQIPSFVTETHSSKTMQIFSKKLPEGREKTIVPVFELNYV